MELPFKIITTKRWREMNERAARAERSIDALTRRIDTIRDGLAAVERTADGLRLDVRNIRRKLNEKPRQSWPHGTFTGSAASSR